MNEPEEGREDVGQDKEKKEHDGGILRYLGSKREIVEETNIEMRSFLVSCQMLATILSR